MSYRLPFPIVMAIVGVALSQTSVKHEDLNCSISGTVSDPDGKPLQSRIIAYEIVVRNGWQTPFARCSANTDRDAKFSCGRIPAGHYLVTAYSTKPMPASESGKDGSGDPNHEAKLVYPLTFYPNTTFIDDASILRLRSGESGWAGVVITPARAKTLSVTLPVNTPKSAVSVAVQSSDFDLNLREPIQHDRERGKFVIDSVAEGQYLVTGNWFADGADHHGSVVSRVSAKPEVNVAIRESTAAKIAGRVSFDTPPGGSTAFTLALYPKTGGTSSKRYVSEVGSDGTFDFGVVGPGDYFAALINGNSWYVRSVSSHGKPYPSGMLSVTEDSPSRTLDVEVSAKAASVSGVLQDRGAEAGPGLVVIASAVSGVVTTVTADDQGRYAATGLTPGDYSIFALPPTSDVPYRNPRMLKICSAHGTKVFVDEGQRLTSVGVEVITEREYLPW